jgi:hypothetical protein
LYAAVLRLRTLCQRFEEDKKTLLANEGSVANILDRRLVFLASWILHEKIRFMAASF